MSANQKGQAAQKANVVFVESKNQSLAGKAGLEIDLNAMPTEGPRFRELVIYAARYYIAHPGGGKTATAKGFSDYLDAQPSKYLKQAEDYIAKMEASDTTWEEVEAGIAKHPIYSQLGWTLESRDAAGLASHYERKDAFMKGDL